MTVIEKNFNLYNYFFYQKGKIITKTPWNRPTYFKVKEYLFEIKNTTEIMKDYNLYLIGGILWDFNKTWKVNINLIGNPYSYIVLEDYMHYMYDIALNKYNLLIDITWVNTKPEDIIFTPDYNFTYNNEYLKIGYTKKQTYKEHIELDLRNDSYHILQGDYLVSGNWRNKPMKESFIEKVKNNPNSITKITFPVKEFLENDEEYFLKNTNRSQYL
jgi:hypothetical protein